MPRQQQTTNRHSQLTMRAGARHLSARMTRSARLSTQTVAISLLEHKSTKSDSWNRSAAASNSAGMFILTSLLSDCASLPSGLDLGFLAGFELAGSSLFGASMQLPV